MLALRVWGALPGAAIPDAPAPSPHPLPRSLDCPVPESVVMQARLVRDHSASHTVFASLGSGRLLLHPVRGAVMAACQPLPAETGLALVACELGRASGGERGWKYVLVHVVAG